MRKVLTVFFLLFIICIPFGWLTGIGSNIKLTEKRILAQLPAFSFARVLDRELYVELENYFNDHFVFRGPFVKTKNWIDHYILKTSSAKKIHIGREGWLFHTKSLGDYLLNGCEYREKIRGLAKGLQNVERELARQGQIFIFVIAPNKATIYPEYVGLNNPNSPCSKSRYDLLLEAFEEFPVKGFIRLDEILMEAKKNGLLYHKTGTHWSLKGDRIAVEAILGYLESAGVTKQNALERYLPEIETQKEFRIGDLGKATSLRVGEVTETAKKFIYKSETSVEKLEPLINNKRHFRSKSKAHEGEVLLPSAVIYRDSFMTEPLEILKGSFESTHAIWTYNMLAKETQDDLNSSRIVILEMVERNLNHLF